MDQDTLPVGAMTGEWHPASFRDGAARLFRKDERLFRRLSPEAFEQWKKFSGTDLFQRWVQEGRLIGTSVASDIELVLEHTQVAVVSYPYEWPFSLLKKAALLQIDLQSALMEIGFTLRDGRASNVLFRGTMPVFVDIGSIGRLVPDQFWPPLNQFLSTTLYPLLLAAHRGLPYQSWLRGSPERGMTTDEANRVFRIPDVRLPGVLKYVALKAFIDRLASRGFVPAQSTNLPPAMTMSVMRSNIRALRHVVSALNLKRVQTQWVSYKVDCYDCEPDLKQRWLVQTIQSLPARPRLVWDLGCNRGDYAVAAAKYADYVVALDKDPWVVDRLASRCDLAGVTNILPLVIDIADPSPGQGWTGTEETGFLQRSQPDLVLALALLHHIILGSGVPPAEFIAWLSRIARFVVLEHIAPDDAQCRSLLENRPDGHHAVPTVAEFTALLAGYFHVRDRVQLTPTRMGFLLESQRAPTG
jgi:hypothetical protein